MKRLLPISLYLALFQTAAAHAEVPLPSQQLLQLHQATEYMESYAKKKCPRGLSYADQMLSQVIQKTQISNDEKPMTGTLAQDIADAVTLRRQAPMIEREDIEALNSRLREKAAANSPNLTEQLKRQETQAFNCEAPAGAQAPSIPNVPTVKVTP